MTIQIPLEYSPRFKSFFIGLDDSLDRLMIKSYGVSITTLEEVFLKIGHLADPSSIFGTHIDDSSRDGPGRQPQDDESKLKRANSLPLNRSMELNSLNNSDMKLPSKDDPLHRSYQSGITPNVLKGQTLSDLEFRSSEVKLFNSDKEVTPAQASAEKLGESLFPQADKRNEVPKSATIEDEDIVIQSKENKSTGQPAVKHDIGYSLESSPTNTSFCNNLAAVMIKRVLEPTIEETCRALGESLDRPG